MLLRPAIKEVVKFLFLSFSLFFSFAVNAQENGKAKTDTASKKQSTLTVSADFRVRAEYRRGYRIIPTADTGAAFFVNQRSRINIDFKTKGFDLYASLQDARVWGQQDPREGQGTPAPTSTTTYPLYFYEIYAEPHLGNKFSVRIGRQRIMYDNQRLFAENDWRLPGNSHDAVRLVYNNKKNFVTEFTGAYNQYGENNYTTNYKPNGLINYKVLLLHYLNYKINEHVNFLTINCADGFQSSLPADYKTTYMRFTSGGRVEYTAGKWYAAFSGYYQYGRDSSGRKLAAYYLQPEIKYTSKTFTTRLGVEYLSGHDGNKPVTKDNNFVPLYGVAHRFMGNMDFFTTFPADVNNAGLVNPYLFLQYQKKKTTLRCENHLFFSQNNFLLNGTAIKKYLGFENDWRINYKANSFTEIESGFCWAAVTESAVIIKKSGDTKTFPYWLYMSIRFTPTIGKFSF